MAGWGTFFGKLADWIPGKRESIQNQIAKTKEDMADVINKVPFDSAKYQLLANKLSKLEAAEQRAS